MSLSVRLAARRRSGARHHDVADKKPRKKCEYISEVGSNRQRRVCQIINAPAVAKPTEQGAVEAAKTTADHGQHEHQSGSNE